MKARILSAKSPAALETQLAEIPAGDVAHVGYAIDSKTGTHHALVLFHDPDDAKQRGTVREAASRFISDALDAGPSRSKEV